MGYIYPRSLETGGLLLGLLERSKFDPAKPMGLVAKSQLSHIVALWLLGEHKATMPYLVRTGEWLDLGLKKARAENEFHFHLYQMYRARALVTWMLDDSNDVESWDKARIHMEAAWREKDRPWGRKEVLEGALDKYMLFGVMTGEADDVWLELLETYDLWVAPQKTTPKISRKLKLREYCYLLLRSDLGIEPLEDAKLLTAGRKMLSANLDQHLLGRGRFLDAASMLKLVYVDRNAWSAGLEHHPPTALEVILKAFDDLPISPKPDYVSADETTTARIFSASWWRGR